MSACPGFPRVTTRGGRSRSCANGATTPARSTSRADSGWTTRGPSGSARWPARRTWRCRCMRRSSASWAISRRAGRKFSSAVGALDRSAGIAAACGAAGCRLPPWLPARPLPRGCDRLGRRPARHAARATRGQGTSRAVRRRGDGARARPRLARRRASRSRAARAGCGRCSTSRTCTRRVTARISRQACSPRRSKRSTMSSTRECRSTSTSPTSPTRTATRSTTCPYGEGTLRADPLREALERFDRPATVISESPDEASSQAIREILRTP